MTVDQVVTVNFLAACLLDGILGDPRWLPHPVRFMGHLISWCEVVGRELFTTPRGQRGIGVVIALLVPGVSYWVCWWGLELAATMPSWFANLLWVILAYTTLAAKDLASHAWEVYGHLQSGSLPEARKAVSLIVGRDTDKLNESEVARATIETVAESTSDGVIAPLFYLVLGGPPLAFAYKAINTLDSMIGHNAAPYRDIGWASAKFDDLANWVPARLSARLLLLGSGLQGQTCRKAWEIYRRDCAKHASPNSGHPEAAMAGALEIQLGGATTYDGVLVDRPQLGKGFGLPQPYHIPMALKFMWVSFGMATLLGTVVTFWWNSL